MRISESDLILPALFVISENPGVTTSKLIQELNRILKPQGEDAEILSGRSDTKFSQIVRNLVSHGTLEKSGYATYSRGKKRRSGGNFYITEQGQSYLQKNQEIIENLIMHGFPYGSVIETIREISSVKSSGKRIDFVDENLVIQEGRQHYSASTTYERSDAVRKAAIEHYRRRNGHIVCEICGFDFLEVYGERGRNYIEIHHEKPLYETEGEERTVFLHKAIENVKPVCANCHRIIHRKRDDTLSIAEMKNMVKNQHFEN